MSQAQAGRDETVPLSAACEGKALRSLSSLEATTAESSDDAACEENCARECPSTAPVVETSRAVYRKNKYGEVKWVNDYKMVAKLGRGAFAQVNLCEKVAASGEKEQYAIKIFSKSLMRKRGNFTRQGRQTQVHTLLDKVQTEIAIMKKLRHPHLVRLFEVIDDPDEDAMYIVMEYMEGGAIMDFHPETLAFTSRLTGGLLGEAMAATAFREVLAGLSFLHMHHIAHRDLKPENILVDYDGHVKIADFGVAHYFEEEEQLEPRSLRELVRTQSRGITTKTEGTWSFWAPEMCSFQSFSAYAADVWAAGVCLWIFVFGELPFFADGPDELFDSIREDTPQMPRAVSPALAKLLNSLMQKDPAHRISVSEAATHEWVRANVPRHVAPPTLTVVTTIDVSQEDVALAFSPVRSIEVEARVQTRLKHHLGHARHQVDERKAALRQADAARMCRVSSALEPEEREHSDDEHDGFFDPAQQDEVARRVSNAEQLKPRGLCCVLC